MFERNVEFVVIFNMILLLYYVVVNNKDDYILFWGRFWKFLKMKVYTLYF